MGTSSRVYRDRIKMVLRILEQRTGVSYGPMRIRVIWGPILPQDISRLAQQERSLVEAGLHSRRRAIENLGIEDPETELGRIEEEGHISARTLSTNGTN